MEEILTFQRIESKYLLSREQEEALVGDLSRLLIPDVYGESSVSSLYLDTPDFRILRQSLDKGAYREKLRIRSYGVPRLSDPVFFEIKKKMQGVVYKRREKMTLGDAYRYLQERRAPSDTQIMREIDYAFSYYGLPAPALLISYERRAYTLSSAPQVRLTLDRGIRYRAARLRLEEGREGIPILPPDQTVLEIKTPGGMPLSLAHQLDRLNLYPTAFSKFKRSYQDILLQSTKE